MKNFECLQGLWLVYYSTEIEFASTNKKHAEAYMEVEKDKYKALPWKCTGVAEYGNFCWSEGNYV